MGKWFRKWHVILAIVLGVYLAIPKPAEPILRIGEARELPLGSVLRTSDGYTISLTESVKVDESRDTVTIPWRSAAIDEEPEDQKEKVEADKKAQAPFTVELTDAVKPLVRDRARGGISFGWPLAAYRWNLGQDLAGGTSLRMLVRSESVVEAEEELLGLYRRLMNRADAQQLPAAVREIASTQVQPGRPVPLLSDANLDALEALIGADETKSLRDSIARYSNVKVSGGEDLVGPTIEKLNRRLNSSGMTELNIVPAGVSEIEVKLPSLSTAETERLKDLLRSTGRLEFLLMPSEQLLGDKKAKDLWPNLPETNPTWYRWYDVLPSQTAATLDSRGELRFDRTQNLWVEANDERSDPAFGDTFAVVTDRLSPPIKFVGNGGEEKTARIKIEAALVQVRFPDNQAENPDATLPDYPISGDHLKNAEPASDRTGGPAVSFELQGRGVSVMSTITGRHMAGGNDPRLLAVAVDRQLYSAATIQDQLSDRVQVSGRFTRAEVARYVETLKSGSLPVSLTLIGEETIGPAEGADNVNRGIRSIIIGALLVFAFVLVFYRRVGLLVFFNLALTISLILAVMSIFLSTLTLPGIAGLVLTLGMAVDSNILINERIREERLAGASGRAAIESGFRNAMSAIVDGNLTTLITAIILAKIGTGAIAGFALTLSVGILATLYMALLVYKSTLFFFYDRKIITDVGGYNLLRGTHIPFVKIGKRAFLPYLVLMLGAFAYFIAQASDGSVFGIDFRGGTQVVMQLNEPVAREKIANDILKDVNGLQVQARTFLGETSEGGNHSRWEMRFPRTAENEDEDVTALEQQVLSMLRERFSGMLAPNGFEAKIGDVTKTDIIVSVRVSRPEGVETESEPWFSHLGIRGAEDPASAGWFTGIGGTALRPQLEVVGDTQTVTWRIENVDIAVGDADLEGKLTQAWEAVKKRLHDDLDVADRKVVGGTDGEFPGRAAVVSHRPRTGRVRIDLELLAAMNINRLRDTLRGFTVGLNDPLFDSSLEVTPVDADGEVARKFLVRSKSGDLAYSTDGRAASIVAAGGLQGEMERWFDDNEPGNHISMPFPRSAAIGGRVAGEMKTRAVVALLIALIAIVIYIGIRFRSRQWGYAAVSALVFDTALTLGGIALADTLLGGSLGDLKIDLNAIAALLAVIGYSLNDTIIIFDRIREELLNDVRAKRQRPLSQVIDEAINLTLSRTILTSASTFVVVLAMVILGGPAIRTFAWTLMFGLLFGTYSSVFRAGPMLLFFTGRGGDLRGEVAAEEAARKEAERAEAEAMAAFSTEREVENDDDGENSDDTPAKPAT